ncbi:acyl-CoA carboxylase subunit epsilon [Aldersonia kunmingensis]|uniref:acyl-CoA carboxylase subunit epsilon n=1 Tax=Aldersonia kunmingensis TaxID=408066 RepID=UPI0008327A13|nr:acyl-CoA carboxylase subunit epsilon [Aldersonia kunmingensis]
MTAVAEETTLSDAELTELAGAVDGAAGAETAPEAQQAAADNTTIKVLKGNPDDVEVAALVAVLAAAAASDSAPVQSSRPVETWGIPTLLHRGTPPFSPYSYPFVSHIRD